MRLGESDDGNLPTSTTQRQAYDLIAAGFRARHERPAARRGAAAVSRATTRSLTDISAAIAEDARTSRRCSRRRSSPQRQRSRRSACSRRRRPTARRRRPGRARCASDVLPDGDRHERRAGLRRRAHRHVHRHRRPDQQPAPLLHRRGRAAVVPAADAGVPLDPRPAHRGAHEPAVGRRRVRRDGRRVPVGLGQGTRRAREHRAHRVVRADDDVRGAVRALDGLPGVPAHAGARGVRRDRRHPSGRRARPRAHRARHHVGRADHDLRVRRVRR